MQIAGHFRLTALPRLWRSLAVFWLVYLVFLASSSIATKRMAGEPVPYARLATTSVIDLVGWILLTYGFFLLVDVAEAQRNRWRRRALFTAAMAAGWAGIAALGAVTRLVNLRPFHFDRASILQALGPQPWPALFMMVAIGAVARGMSWWQKEVRSRRRQDEAEAALVRTELSMVSDQLEPHFLLNTLTGISALAGRDAPAAREMIAGLQELLSWSSTQGQAFVRLGDELLFIRRYLALQSMRFPARLRFSISADDDLRDVLVPRLILQPLVENAVKYGIGQLEEGGMVAIEAGRRGQTLLLHVSNSNGGGSAAPGIGIGVACVRARLRLHFGERQRVTMYDEKSARETRVTVTLPLARVAENAA